MSMPPTTKRELLAPIRQRWIWVHKFWICHGIQHGIITTEETMRAHKLTSEELEGWYDIYRREGAEGLRRQSIAQRRRAA